MAWVQNARTTVRAVRGKRWDILGMAGPTFDTNSNDVAAAASVGLCRSTRSAKHPVRKFLLNSLQITMAWVHG